MKKFFQFLTVSLALAALAACVKEKPTLDGVPMFTITASIPDEDASPAQAQADEPGKAGFTPDGTTLRLAWQAGDKIRVFNHANPSQNAEYTIKDGFTDKTAQFEGPAVSGTSFDIVAPASFSSPDAAQNGNPDLTQNGNGTTGHLTFTAKLENVSKDDLADIVFNSGWATNHGATLKKGAILKFVFPLPNEITAPEKVMLTEFSTKTLENPISVNITGVDLTSEHTLTAYAQAGWEDVPFSARSYFTVGVLDGDGTYYSLRHRMANVTGSILAGKVNRIQLPATYAVAATGNDKWIPQLFAGGNGTEGDPYLIANAKHLDNMHVDGVLKSEERVYFRLIKDIDMQSYLQSHTWVPLNSSSPYDYLIDFDGDGHTIDHFSCSFDPTGRTDAAHQPDSKPSFFGLLYGTCKNVNFTNATITTNNGTAGILGGYVGYSGKKAVVQNVHVSGTITKTKTYTDPNSGNFALGDSGVGGLAGRVDFAYIDSSSADVTINCTVQAYVGGLFGVDFGESSRIRNCWTSGVIHGDQRVGGICGGIMRPETQIINCFSTATVDALRCGGGIGGHCNLDNNTAGTPETLEPDNVFQGCIAWQTSFATRTQNSNGDFWSSGAVLGYVARKSYLTDCYRHPNLSFKDYNSVFTLYDQNNASPSSPLSITNPNSTSFTHYYPYHGKVAGSTRLSTVAQSLGWDSNVWDFSGDIPVLTGAVEAEPAAETPASGEPTVQALSVGQSSLARSFPGCYSVRGAKSATQDGLTWSHVNVTADGAVKYFTATGTVSAGWMDSGTRKQALYVVDYDLSNTNYEVKIVHCSPTCVASQVHAAVGAVATINGGYESGSIAIKANMGYTWQKDDSSLENNILDNIKAGSEVVTNYPFGSPKSFMPNNTIGDTGVENWKCEGTFYCDGKQDVRIAFDGYGGGASDKYGANTYNRTVRQERLWYRLGTDNEAGFLSSSPIIHANYIRFGYTYKDRCSGFGGSLSNSEHPKVHQSGAYPRTAVAIAYPEYDDKPHLLLIVVDGRYADSAGGYGYSAYWLERHIANAFGPKYTLNLDGGGSSTMCVQDQGDATTNVVNYPCDSDSHAEGKTIHTHDGQRARDTFICIIPKN